MTSLLPASSGLFEQAFESSLASRWDELRAAVPVIRTAKLVSPPPSFLPFLVYEYGLGELTPYVPNLYELINAGVRWSRIRGTYAAVAMGLSFVGVTATVEPAWHGRVWWNSAQLRFPDLPANDDPLLERIEGITRLSFPMRSDLRRGVHQYDIGAIEGDGMRLDASHLERESGIQIRDGGTLWSFGRTMEIPITLTEAEGLAIGNWLEIPEEAGLLWVDMTYPWVTAEFRWADSPAIQRRALMAAWFAGRELYLRFADGAGGVIGYRRVRSCHPVALASDGQVSFAGQPYAVRSGGQIVYIEAMTDFADADGVEARSVALIAGASRAEGVPPGRLWLAPDELTGGATFAETAVNIPLRTTVRERFKFLVRF